MDIYFGSKNENNDRRRDEFLNLSPVERVFSFLRMLEESKDLNKVSDVHPNYKKGNFILSKDV